MQAFLVEGIVRWNESRAASAVEVLHGNDLRSFDYRLRQLVNEQAEEVLERRLINMPLPLDSYTGEKIGVQYLLAQSEGQSLPEEFSTDDPQIDDGFIEDQQPFDDTVADPTDVEAYIGTELQVSTTIQVNNICIKRQTLVL